jgi:hypothetical protein
MNEATASVLMITVFIMAGLVIYLTIINALDRRASNRRIDDLLTRLMARDVPEYVSAKQSLGQDPEIMARLDELAADREYQDYRDRIPVG